MVEIARLAHYLRFGDSVVFYESSVIKDIFYLLLSCSKIAFSVRAKAHVQQNGREMRIVVALVRPKVSCVLHYASVALNRSLAATR